MSRSRAWTWRQAILESDLKPTTRHVLLTLSCYMNDVGGGCYPTTKTLAAATGLSERAVCEHLGIAKAAGWVEVYEHGFRGRKWKNNEYRAIWPKVAQGADAGSVPHSGQGTDGRSVRRTEALTDDQRGTDPDDAEALTERQSINPINNPDISPGDGSPRPPARETGIARAGDERGLGRHDAIPRRNDLGEIGEVVLMPNGQEYVSIIIFDHWDLVHACIQEWQAHDGKPKDSLMAGRSATIPKWIVDRVRLTEAVRADRKGAAA